MLRYQFGGEVNTNGNGYQPPPSEIQEGEASGASKVSIGDRIRNLQARSNALLQKPEKSGSERERIPNAGTPSSSIDQSSCHEVA
jgi:hypothetical protein